MTSLVADYGASSSEEECDTEVKSTAVVKEPEKFIKLPPPEESTVKKSKKRKSKEKFAFSIIPPEIQAALQRPPGDSDDSDDEFYSVRKKRNVTTYDTETITLPNPTHEYVKPPTQHHHPSEAAATGPYPPPELLGSCSTASRDDKKVQARALERALQQGQFDALPDNMPEVKGMAPDDWVPDESDEARRKLEKDLRMSTQFCDGQNAGSMSGTRLMPSRLQRQRHQLNQLTYDARLREFELLEKKGQGLKTKRETQAKYGW